MATIDPRHVPPEQRLHDELFERRRVEVVLKRDDLVGGVVLGNKWRKLRLNLEGLARSGHEIVLTFGGAFSNHLRAVAAAGASVGVRTVGVVRGEEHLPLNWSLSEAVSHGMTLVYLDREAYRRKADPEILRDLQRRYGPAFLIPEGGSNALGVLGCRDIGEEVGDDVDVVMVPCGTGGTLAGLSAGLRDGQRALGIAVLKGAGFLVEDVRKLQQGAGLQVSRERWSIDLDHHYGGFAKADPNLRGFVREFESRHGERLERVYVAKMLAALYDLVEQGRFRNGTKILAVITGPSEPSPRP